MTPQQYAVFIAYLQYLEQTLAVMQLEIDMVAKAIREGE